MNGTPAYLQSAVAIECMPLFANDIPASRHDCSHNRMIIQRHILDTDIGVSQSKKILCSSHSSSPKMHPQDFSRLIFRDPVLGYQNGQIRSTMYTENSKSHLTNAFLVSPGHFIASRSPGLLDKTGSTQKNGMNVWIYPPPGSFAFNRLCICGKFLL